jgi:hypothetical protein
MDGKKTKRDMIEKAVETKVKEIVDRVKATHGKYIDPDFGPTEQDPNGAISLYGNEPPAPAGVNKYPDPATIRWDRPQYEDEGFSKEEEEEEVDEFADDFAGGKEDSNVRLCTFLWRLSLFCNQKILIV